MALFNGKWEADDLPTVIGLAMNELKDYLTTGATDADSRLIGLDTAPQFIVSQGTGMEGDETQYGYAQILFLNDEYEGRNYVRILEYGGDWLDGNSESTIIPIRLLLDCGTANPIGALTEGADARSADNVLAGHVLRLLGLRAAYVPLFEHGFHNVRVRPEMALKQGTGPYRSPVLMTAELWVSEA